METNNTPTSLDMISLDMILDAINKLGAKIDLLSSAPQAESKSSNLNELFTALAKAQSEMPAANKNSQNPYFKSMYSDLKEVVTTSRPALAKNGLSVIQQISPTKDGHNILTTVLAHSSGQWIETKIRIIPPKNDIQTLGSHLTYLRRYSYGALCGVVTSDEDDDGEMTMATERQLTAKGPATNKYNAKNEASGVIAPEQREEIEIELANMPDFAEQVLEAMRISNFADLPKSKYRAVIERIREVKKTRGA